MQEPEKKLLLIEEIKTDVQKVLSEDQLINRIDEETLTEKITNRINPLIDKFYTETGERILGFTASIPGSQISLNNKNHEEKLLEFFLLFSQLQYPVKGSKAEKLFKNFSQPDIVMLLTIHFEAFKSHKSAAFLAVLSRIAGSVIAINTGASGGVFVPSLAAGAAVGAISL